VRLDNLNIRSSDEGERIVPVEPDRLQLRSCDGARLPFPDMGFGALAFVFLFFAALCAFAPAAVADPHGQVSAVLQPPVPVPGQPAELDLTLTINAGFHAQSHTPAEAYLIPLMVTVQPAPGITIGDPKYPAGESTDDPQLGHENVYTGQIVIPVPITFSAAALASGSTVQGRIRYQACNSTACFPPVTLPFSVSVSATGSSTATTAAATAPAMELTHADTAASAPPPPPRIFGQDLNSNAYLLAFFAAFVVGMIFNVMPCVLPVVPLKIMGFYEVSQHDRRKSIVLGAVFSAGLIASFGVLAILIVALRVINWGGLFQETWFTITIVIVLTVMAFSLFGFFTVNLPGGLYRFTPRHDTYTGNFLFGVLTAALSTPCTFGMFVGLLTWALSQPASIGVGLIMTVGVGMAFPYFVLSAFPEAARNFPRTGPWAEVVKQMMGFLLLGTAVYFAQPLYERFVSDQAFWWTLFGVIAAGGVFLIARTTQIAKHFRPRAIAVCVALLFVVPSLFAARRLTVRAYEWQPYSDQAVVAARASGKPVLIDFTATWCGNCHYIEAFVLHDPKVIAAVRNRDVVMIKADVTYDGSAAGSLLDKLDPARAIPLTALYLPGSDQPKLLDGIYSSGDLLKVLNEE
jgi:thiol:disulfide interchange protein